MVHSKALFCVLTAGTLWSFGALIGILVMVIEGMGTGSVLGTLVGLAAACGFPAAELNLFSLVEVDGGVLWVYLPIFGINEVPSMLTVIGGCIVSCAIIIDSVGTRYKREMVKVAGHY